MVVDQNKAAAEARRRKAQQPAEVRDLLRGAFRSTGDRTDRSTWADVTGWWRDPTLLAELGPALASLFDGTNPTVVIGPQSRGALVGALVAVHLGVGLVEARKNDRHGADSDAWRYRTTPPDYRYRHLRLGFPKRLLRAGERVLFVDDWIDTGSQALATHALVAESGAEWLGAAVIVDDLGEAQRRRDLIVRSLLRSRDVWP